MFFSLCYRQLFIKIMTLVGIILLIILFAIPVALIIISLFDKPDDRGFSDHV
jgi:hypothetical protein